MFYVWTQKDQNHFYCFYVQVHWYRPCELNSCVEASQATEVCENTITYEQSKI